MNSFCPVLGVWPIFRSGNCFVRTFTKEGAILVGKVTEVPESRL